MDLPTPLIVVLGYIFFGTLYQRSLGEEVNHNMSQASVSRCVREVSALLEDKICPLFIRFPQSNEEKQNIKRNFYQKTGFPGVIGCIDCTHVDIIAPNENEHLFIDRKGKHSMNVQLICDSNLKILSVVSWFPGSTHDAAIWQVSRDKAIMENGRRNGDSVYPLQPWLMTPYFNTSTEQEIKYNEKHTSTRNCIERCNGLLKQRFRCLNGERKLRYSPEVVVTITNVCCALHNKCLQDGDVDTYMENTNISDIYIEDSMENDMNEARVIRNLIASGF